MVLLCILSTAFVITILIEGLSAWVRLTEKRYFVRISLDRDFNESRFFSNGLGGIDMVINEKFYNGYEGEPSIIFAYKKNNSNYKFVIWEGYFDEIMKSIKPGDDGWKGLALCYHMYTGWYEEDDWRIENLQDAYQQYQSIDTELLSESSKEVLNKICEILIDAINNKYNVYISID